MCIRFRIAAFNFVNRDITNSSTVIAVQAITTGSDQYTVMPFPMNIFVRISTITVNMPSIKITKAIIVTGLGLKTLQNTNISINIIISRQIIGSERVLNQSTLVGAIRFIRYKNNIIDKKSIHAHFITTSCCIRIGGTINIQPSTIPKIAYSDQAIFPCTRKSHSGHTKSGTHKTTEINNAVVCLIFLSIINSLFGGYGGKSIFLLSMFGFITGVEQSGQRFSFELSSTPQFTQ